VDEDDENILACGQRPEGHRWEREFRGDGRPRRCADCRAWHHTAQKVRAAFARDYAEDRARGTRSMIWWVVYALACVVVAMAEERWGSG